MTDVEIISTARSGRRRPGVRAAGLVGSVVTVVASVLLPSARAVGADPLATARAQAAQVNAQLQSDAGRLDSLSQQYERAQAQVSQLQAQIAQAHLAIAQDQVQVAADQANLRQQAIAAYMAGSTDSGLESIFGPGGEQAVVTNEYTALATGSITNAVDGLNLAQTHLAQQQAQLQASEDQAQSAVDQVAAARRAAEATMAAQQGTLRSLTGQISQLVAQQRAAAEAAAYQAYQAYLARLNATKSSSNYGNVAVAPGASGAVQAAESQIGVPYPWGGEQPGVGFDCSGLTQWAWRQAGVEIPRTADDQFHAITRVSLADMQPGDLVFWGSDGYAEHVGMYVGNGDVVHAPSSGDRVRIQAIWDNGLLGAGRP
ncbi:MAG: C40 family peptidase [Acidimicrobiales bacterium]